MVSKYGVFEGPDPAAYCAAGFAIVNVDPRGTWASQGIRRTWDTAEGQDEYDLIEWLATQEWCTGKIGLAGVSYLAISQWFAAALCPPHLAAINPWEGFSDTYRERVFHGGIPETKFVNYAQALSNFSLTQIEDVAGMRDAYPFDNAYWANKRAELANINVPAYVVASWSDHGLHTRGTFEGFKQAASQHKYLEVHGRKKWRYYYEPESVSRQLAFFGRFLKDTPNEVDQWPRVRYEVRDTPGDGEFYAADAWPIPGTEYRALHLDAVGGSLMESPPTRAAVADYDAATGRICFDVRFDTRTVIVGNSALALCVEARGSDDMDLFVGLEKLDASGKRVEWPYFSHREDGSMALGWLRVSHRALDESRSTPEQPWHLHTAEERLSEGEIVEVQIEILPSGTLFHPGETLRLVVQGHDLHVYDHPATIRHEATRNTGRHLIHTGAQHGSTLLIPVLPDPASSAG
jgi:putative CocE/NonD family hydrolase